ncbi:serine O-acetyltransferase [Loktanella sp. SALINAS62]|uniref:serine O-acetyltransferase n=1 Tax=Loktanella sp. SALINAS62 TaxID=2706124 RepID=UPI001B8CE743|nr:serine O-acetyltransferase [Loktanella sp. SALINAS62]MBS1303581.1 serine O-acetyltransferase [Loktanella sp. SALINAS62]
MAHTQSHLLALDPVWDEIRGDAAHAVRKAPAMGAMLHAGILQHDRFDDALAYRVAMKLASDEMSAQNLRDIADDVYASDSKLALDARADLIATFERDPACHRMMQPLIFFKGFQAVQAHRLAHWLWNDGQLDLAYFIQMRASEVFGVDIHPGAQIGKGLMIDHAHSVVVGETAVVGDNVSMLHSVTLGGTGKDEEKRHPTIENGVLIGAGAKVLGNITVGHCSRIAAGSVVLHDVPQMKTVAGVPAKIVGEAGCSQPSILMDHMLGPMD